MLVGTKKRVAYIGNAKDYYGEPARAEKVKEHKAQFESLGFAFKEIDLRQYFKTKVPGNILDNFGLVWCAGGNTFLLNTAMVLSGFDKVLINKVKSDKIAYGGSSAGSIIAGPTLKGADHGDAPEDVGKFYQTDVIWQGLGLVDFVCIPHYTTAWYEQDALLMEKQLKRDGTKYRALEDGQVFIVNKDRGRLYL